jgi:hypothetical protein
MKTVISLLVAFSTMVMVNAQAAESAKPVLFMASIQKQE